MAGSAGAKFHSGGVRVSLKHVMAKKGARQNACGFFGGEVFIDALVVQIQCCFCCLLQKRAFKDLLYILVKMGLMSVLANSGKLFWARQGSFVKDKGSLAILAGAWVLYSL